MHLKLQTFANGYALMRRRMIRETELALLIGLTFPDRAPRIPSIETGKGRFRREFAEHFWREALGLTDSDVSELRRFAESVSGLTPFNDHRADTY